MKRRTSAFISHLKRYLFFDASSLSEISPGFESPPDSETSFRSKSPSGSSKNCAIECSLVEWSSQLDVKYSLVREESSESNFSSRTNPFSFETNLRPSLIYPIAPSNKTNVDSNFKTPRKD